MVKCNQLYIRYGSKVMLWLNVIVSTSDMEAKLFYGLIIVSRVILF